MNIYLVGYRCSGKTTVGKYLARHLGLSFVDADRELVRRSGTTIDDIVRDKGWSFFRARETAILVRLCRTGGLVVATGGGVVLDENNVGMMADSGVVIWLRVSPDTIKSRMTADTTTGAFRPGLTDRGVVGEIETVLSERTPLYENAAELIQDTDNKTVADISAEIVRKLEGLGYVEQLRNTL